VRPRLHHYAWREPLLLLSTMLEQKHVDALVRRLVQGTSRYEHDLLRDLRLAIAIVGEDAPLRKQTVDMLFNKWRRLVDPISRLALLIVPLLILFLILVFGFSQVYQFSFWFTYITFSIATYYMVLRLFVRFGFVRPFFFWYRSDWIMENLMEAGGIFSSRTFPIFQRILYIADGRTQENTIRILEEIDDPGANPILHHVLSQGDTRLRWRAAEALGKIGDPAAISALRNALFQPNWFEYRDSKPIFERILIRIQLLFKRSVAGPRYGDVRRSAALALRRIGGSAMSILREVQDDVPEDVKPYIIEALLQTKDTDATPALHQAAYLTQTDVQNTGEPVEMFELLHRLRDNDSDVREQTIMELSEIGDSTVISVFQQALHDEDWHVRRAAAEALGRIGDTTAIPALVEALRTGTLSTAARSLTQIGDASAIPALRRSLHSKPDVREDAAHALKHLVVLVYDTTQARKTTSALWWAAEAEALEQAANHLSVLEVQANPGSDPLVSPAPVRQVAWGWAVFVGVVLVAAILAVFLLPADFWQAHVVVAVATVLTILAGIAGLFGVSVRDLFRRKEG
jgi:HEAT repeat protein